MGVWQGLGVNYKSQDPTKISADMDLFRKIGITRVRIHVPGLPGGWSSGDTGLNNWRAVAKQFHDAGFYTVWGVTRSSFGLSNKDQYHDTVMSEAAYCAAHAVCDELHAGNEIEVHSDGSMTHLEVRNFLRQLATDVKPTLAASNILLSYAVEKGSTSNTYGSYQWTQEGKGSFDRLAINVYGNWNTSTRAYIPEYVQAVTQMASAYSPSQWYVSEFNVDGSAAKYNAMPEETKEDLLTKEYKFIKDSGVLSAFLYQYRGLLDSDADSFYVRYSNDVFRLLWNPLVTNNGRRILTT